MAQDMPLDTEKVEPCAEHEVESTPTTMESPQHLDPKHDPYRWPTHRKVSIALAISLGQLVSLMSASMMAAALPQIKLDLRMGDEETQASFSVYTLALAFAPFLTSPSSELFGRKPAWIGGHLVHIVSNALCLVGKSKAIMIVGRFLAGSEASCGIALNGPTSPIVGRMVSQRVDWPCPFWVLSIVDTAVVMIACLVIRETYTPLLLHRLAALADQRKKTWSELFTKFASNLSRPFRISWQQPIIQLLAFTMAVEFGIYIVVLSVYARIFINQFRQSPGVSSLHYIAIAIGAWAAAQDGGHLMNYMFARLKAKTADGQTNPEFRVPVLALGVITTPAGLIWLGWSAQNQLPWVMVDIGSAIFTCGAFTVVQAVLAYLLDEFTLQVACANAAARMPSNVFGFAFPLFAPRLFDIRGYGWACSASALAWTALAVPMPMILWKWGAKLRPVGREQESRVAPMIS